MSKRITMMKLIDFGGENPIEIMVAIFSENITTADVEELATHYAAKYGYRLPITVRFDESGTRYADLYDAEADIDSYRTLTFENITLVGVEEWLLS